MHLYPTMTDSFRFANCPTKEDNWLVPMGRFGYVIVVYGHIRSRDRITFSKKEQHGFKGPGKFQTSNEACD